MFAKNIYQSLFFYLCSILLMPGNFIGAQTPIIHAGDFFSEEEILKMQLNADLKKIMKEDKTKNNKTVFYPATLTYDISDSIKITEHVEIRARGEFRKASCYLPPIMINFKTSKPSILKKLGHLKLVWPCGKSEYEEQLLLKEYLVYKMYNLLTEMSFRVRLIRLSYSDTNNGLKPYTFFAFFIEDVDAMAHRNHCVETEGPRFHTEYTDRKQTTLVSIFQYMIGNTDWAIPLYRNIKLIRPEKDSFSFPYVVPYDFDYCGAVNADYAIPVEELGIATVRDRLYRGFPRTIEELQEVVALFKAKKSAMDSLIMNFEPLSEDNKKEMIQYLEDFYSIIENEKNIKRIFIQNARTK